MRTIEERILNNSEYQNYRETIIESVDTEIALSIYETNKNNPCIIFIPGTMTHPLFYDEFLTKLAQNHYNVVGIHLVSHGKSPREKELYSFSDMLKNVQDTIEFCCKAINGKIFIMGSSQGGILSIALASMDDRIKAVFSHNILIPSMPDSIKVTSIPKIFKVFYKIIPFFMRLSSKILPKFQIPISWYLELDHIFTNETTKQQFLDDPIGLTKYPLFFLASLFSADMSSITDGSIKCPIIVVASKGDTLFPYEYCKKVYSKINAPKKKIIVVDEPHHLIFNESVEKVIKPILLELNNFK